MSSTTSTLNPTGHNLISGGFTISGGSASIQAALADNSDSTEIQDNFGSSNNVVDLTFSGFSLPAGAVIVGVAPVVRGNTASSFTYGIFDGTTYQQCGYLSAVGSVTTFTGTVLAAPPSGGSWTEALVNGSTLRLICPDAASNSVIAKVDLVVYYNQAPTATGTAPNGNATTSEPTFTWTYSDPEGDAQERFQVKVYSDTQYSAAGFDPNTSTPTADSGVVFSSSTSWTCTTPLTNGINYRAFIFVADAGSGGRFNVVTSSGPYAYTTIDVDAAAIPALSVSVDDANNRVQLSAVSTDNLLSYNAASAEQGTTDAAAKTNCTLTQSTPTVVADGTHAFRMTASSAANMAACFGTSTGASHGITAVVAGQVYSAGVLARPNSTQRSVTLGIRWFDASNTLLSTTTGPTASEAASTALTNVICTNATAPANAVWADLIVTVLSAANGEIHDIDALALVPGALYNLLRTPTFGADTNGDGVANNWNSYNFGSDAGFVLSLDSSRFYVGNQSQKGVVGANTGYKGVDQLISMVPGETYTVSYWVYSTVNSTWRLLVDQFLNSGLNHNSVAVNVTANTWTLVSLTGVADSYQSSKLCTVYLRSDTANQTFWLNGSACSHGSYSPSTTLLPNGWTRGGTAGSVGYLFERSSDGGSTWTTVRQVTTTAGGATANQSQSLAIYDYEAPRNTALIYRVAATTADLSTATTSEHSRYASGLSVVYDGLIWIKDPIDPTRNITVNADLHSLVRQRAEAQGAHYAFGRSDPIVVHGTVRKATFNCVLFFQNDTQESAWETLRDSQRTLLMQTGYGDTALEQYYFTLDPVVSTENITYDRQNTAQPRRVTFTARETVAP